MPPRLCLNGKRDIFFFILRGLMSLLLVSFVAVAHAQPVTVQQRAPTEAKPFIVERLQIEDGAKTDPWLRFELRFGEPREKCRTWRFETRGQADGHAVFDLKEPVDQSVILELRDSPQHLELVLGDAECSYRIRIERNK